MSALRPNLDDLAPEVRAYILHLEEQLADADSRSSQRDSSNSEPSEAPSSAMLITATRGGQIKRTPRHLYSRQRRGGMGIFDLDADEADPPAFLAVADAEGRLLIVTDRSRLFFVRVADLPEAEVRDDGLDLAQMLSFQPGEAIAVLVAEEDEPFLNLLSDRGWVRRFSGSQVSRLASGTSVEVRPNHQPVAACWSSGGQDLVIATQSGQGIRFEEKRVPIQGGCLGIRLDGSDTALSIAALTEEDGLFLISDEGKGSVRLASGLRANKSPGAGGKTLLKADRLVAAQTIQPGQDVFAISRLSKIIRFGGDDVPPKEGVVQGVNCMGLRSDQVMAAVVSHVGQLPAQE
jgi:DNA gyrase subunit A